MQANGARKLTKAAKEAYDLEDHGELRADLRSVLWDIRNAAMQQKHELRVHFDEEKDTSHTWESLQASLTRRGYTIQHYSVPIGMEAQILVSW